MRPDSMFALARRVANKIEEGDFKGAIRLASSDDMVADFSVETFNALQAKHPPVHSDSNFPPPPATDLPEEFKIAESDVARAIQYFPQGSAGGPDKLRPQHLKDLLQPLGDDLESPLLSVLVDFCYLVLHGDTPVEVRPFFFGAS